MIASGLPGKDMLDILMIEDEPNIAEAVRFILTRDGWAMTLHGDGEGGVETVPVHAAELDEADRDRVWAWIKENNGGFASARRIRRSGGEPQARKRFAFMLWATGKRTW